MTSDEQLAVALVLRGALDHALEALDRIALERSAGGSRVDDHALSLRRRDGNYVRAFAEDRATYIRAHLEIAIAVAK